MRRTDAPMKHLPFALRMGSLHLRGLIVILGATAALTLITASECHVYLSSTHAQVPLLPSLLFGAVEWLWWGCIAAWMWWAAQRWPSILTFSPQAILLHVALGCLLATSHLSLLQQTLLFADRHWQDWGTAYATLNYVNISRFGLDLLLYGFVFGISGLLHLQSRAQREAIRALKLEKQLSQAQLSALQMQMEPHFLFNTLNAVTTLVELRRNEEAAETLAHLNTILRMTLQRNAPEKIPFAQELAIIESYLAIQQVRFADRLSIKIETSPDALEGLVPCFLLQPVIENAIRHGISHLESDGLIETRVERIGDQLRLRVRDNGPGMKAPLSNGHGIGTRNTRERLSYFYPNAHEYVVVEPETGGYEVTILIPYERQST